MLSYKPPTAPPPPPIPSYLAPRPRDFAGYKLAPEQLQAQDLKLAHPLEGARDSGGQAGPSSFLALSQKLKTNQLVLLHGEESGRTGAHAVFYVDHQAVWQADPSGAGASQAVYRFDASEDGSGLSLSSVAPCFLILTRRGGRVTILQAPQPASVAATPAPLTVLFDGQPLSPPPLSPHDAVCLSALLSRERDHLFLALYEFWEERTTTETRHQPVNFVHEQDALRSAAGVGSPEVPSSASAAGMDVQSGQARTVSTKHALHKLTACTFRLRGVPGISTSASHPGANDMTDVSDSAPAADLVHTFSSLSNHRLPKEQMPSQFENDANWSAPLACWLQLPPQSDSNAAPPSSGPGASSTASATPPSTPFHWFVVARVPYLNETESVVYELRRKEADEAEAAREAREAREDILKAATSASSGSMAELRAGNEGAGASHPKQGELPPFTSDKIETETQGLKNYSIDQEDEDADMDELGLQPAGSFSLNPHVDANVQLYDSLGNLLAARPLKQQAFLFAHRAEGVPGRKQAAHVLGVKQGEELLLYTAHSAPQATPEGLSLGAAGSVARAEGPMPVARMGIVLQPAFAFQGLGYVQSGKQFKKFFMEDGSHHFVVIAEFARHIYVYSRPSASSPTATHWLLQPPHDDSNEDSREILGLQTVVVPAAAVADADKMTDNAAAASGATQGQPLLYVLTARSCRVYRLPTIALA